MSYNKNYIRLEATIVIPTPNIPEWIMPLPHTNEERAKYFCDKHKFLFLGMCGYGYDIVNDTLNFRIGVGYEL